MTLPRRFWMKTTRTDCIIWTGAVNNKGYPCFAVAGVSQLAHRLAWEDVHGPIPDDMTIDHRCRVRNCVNADHLELVTRKENTQRRFKVNGGIDVGGICLNGHSIRDANDLYVNAAGRRECYECRRGQAKRAHAARAAVPGSSQAIRDWATDAGIEIAVHGPIAGWIKTAYAASNATLIERAS